MQKAFTSEWNSELRKKDTTSRSKKNLNDFTLFYLHISLHSRSQQKIKSEISQATLQYLKRILYRPNKDLNLFHTNVQFPYSLKKSQEVQIWNTHVECVNVIVWDKATKNARKIIYMGPQGGKCCRWHLYFTSKKFAIKNYNSITPSVHRVVKYSLKIFQQKLQGLQRVLPFYRL